MESNVYLSGSLNLTLRGGGLAGMAFLGAGADSLCRSDRYTGKAESVKEGFPI